MTEAARSPDRYRSVGYYPGCASEGVGAAAHKSILAVAARLGLKLSELEDWNCCGGTSVGAAAIGVETYLSVRNLSQAVAGGRTAVVMASCTACLRNLKRADHALAHDETERTLVDRLSQAAGHASYQAGQAETMHALEWLTAAIGAEGLRVRTKGRLAGLKVACFTGCLPPATGGRMRLMDELLGAAGATCVEFAQRTSCCGGVRGCTGEPIASQLVLDILRSADAAGAEVMAVACPTCQASIELHQRHAVQRLGEAGRTRVHVIHFAQLAGLALGASRRELGLNGCSPGLRGILSGKGL